MVELLVLCQGLTLPEEKRAVRRVKRIKQFLGCVSNDGFELGKPWPNAIFVDRFLLRVFAHLFDVVLQLAILAWESSDYN